MIISYVIAFCRITIGFVFGISFITKVIHLPVFEETITQFGILPARFSRAASLLFFCSEFVVALLAILGGPLLIVGFSLSIFLLLLFSSTIVMALHRKIQTSCNCFGSIQKPISTIDVWRNAGFILCALFGCIALAGFNSGLKHLSLAEWVLLVPGALIFVALWLHLGEIVQIFQQSQLK